MAWEGVAQWAARALWSAGTAACLLASDLPVGIEVLRRVAHYGKLRAEVSLLPPAGAPRLQARLAQMSLLAAGQARSNVSPAPRRLDGLLCRRGRDQLGVPGLGGARGGGGCGCPAICVF